MTPLYVLPGDVFFTRSTSLLGTAIRWAETDKGEEATWANHVGLVTVQGWMVPPIDSEHMIRAHVIESLWKTEHWAWWDAHKNDKDNEVRVYRNRKLTWKQFSAIKDRALGFVGHTYGWWKLFFHLADRRIFGGKKVLSALLRNDMRPICSYTAAKSFAAGDISFGILPEAADPDEMMDYCERSEDWFLVGSSTTGGAK